MKYVTAAVMNWLLLTLIMEREKCGDLGGETVNKTVTDFLYSLRDERKNRRMWDRK